MDAMINDALKKRILLCPVNIPSKLFPIYVQDAAWVMFDYIFNKNIITINGNEGFSYKELIKILSKISGKSKLIIPVPEMMMYMLKWILEFLHLNIGIKPDQIDRLYSVKESENLNYNFMKLLIRA